MKKPVKKIPFEEYRSIYARVPRLCIDLIIKTGQGILLTLRDIDPGKGLWHFPGGTLLLHESIAEGACRIAHEETGLKVYDPVFLGVMEFNTHGNPYFHTVSLVYQVSHEHKTPTGSYQGREIRFFQELPEKMIDEHKQFIVVNQLLPFRE